MRFFLALVLLISCIGRAQNPPVFRLHLNTEPTSLSPFQQKNSVAGYLYTQITAPLVKIQNGKILPGRATCKYKNPTQIICQIDTKAKWSDGSPLTAEDYKRTFLAFLDPKTTAFRADLLFPIKNAKVYYLGQKKLEDVGIQAKGKTLTLHLEKNQSEFLYTLASALLTPLKNLDIPTSNKANQWLSAGPYQIKKWDSKKSILIEPNPHFDSESLKRPLIEFLFIQEDSVALNLYEKNELDFLRRVPTLFIPKMRGRPDYFEIDQFRFDYIGLHKNIPDLNLKKALIHSLNYEELQAMFWAKSRPGCVGISKDLIEKDICLNFDKQKALEYYQKSERSKTPQLEYLFSKQGGDDHKRAAEWTRAQWKSNLNLNVELNQQDNKIFLERLKSNQVTLFRKGLAPERPTCLSVLENFQKGAIENYLQIDNPKLDQLIIKLSHTNDSRQKRKLCTEAFTELLKSDELIPTGPIFFSILVKPQWTGWKLNELNQLDLTDLHHDLRQKN